MGNLLLQREHESLWQTTKAKLHLWISFSNVKKGTMCQKGIGVMGVTKVGHRKPRDERAKHRMFMARGGRIGHARVQYSPKRSHPWHSYEVIYLWWPTTISKLPATNRFSKRLWLCWIKMSTAHFKFESRCGCFYVTVFLKETEFWMSFHLACNVW